MKQGQHINNALGNVIGEERRQLLDKVKAGVPLEVAVSQFVFYVAHQLAEIVEQAKAPATE